MEGKVELLLLKHGFGWHWSFPNGHVEKAKNEVQTALREVKEETGLSIELHGGSGRAWNTSRGPNVRKQVVFIFLGHTDNQEFKAHGRSY